MQALLFVTGTLAIIAGFMALAAAIVPWLNGAEGGLQETLLRRALTLTRLPRKAVVAARDLARGCDAALGTSAHNLGSRG